MKKISKLLIGTNNNGKFKEIKDLLPKYIKTHSTSEFKLKSPREDGMTFEENSIIKSQHFSKKTKLICLADDSGLEIDILDKNPGIYSARWGGTKGNFKKAISRVYKELLSLFKQKTTPIGFWWDMLKKSPLTGFRFPTSCSHLSAKPANHIIFSIESITSFVALDFETPLETNKSM